MTAVPVKGPGSTAESRETERARAYRLITEGLGPDEEPVDPEVVRSVQRQIEYDREDALAAHQERREEMVRAIAGPFGAALLRDLTRGSVTAGAWRRNISEGVVQLADALIAALDKPKDDLGKDDTPVVSSLTL